MLFDVRAALAEILASGPATPATPATSAPIVADVASVAAQRKEFPKLAKPPEISPQDEPDVARIALGESSNPENETTPSAAPPSRQDPSPYGVGCGGRPLTWTGEVVSLDEWRRLTDWERHGSTGKIWNGLTRQWEPSTGGAA